jgi:uncharacterized GH25 family protein
MEKEEWLKLFDETKGEFRWFLEDYGYWKMIEVARLEDDDQTMLDIMNQAWFMLPDSRFNIMENPKGWSEFLNLLEA